MKNGQTLTIAAIYDSKINTYGMPIFGLNIGMILREVTAAIMDESSYFNKFPADFTLMEIGIYNSETGIITMHDQKINRGTFLEIKSALENQKASVSKIKDIEEQDLLGLDKYKQTEQGVQ